MSREIIWFAGCMQDELDENSNKEGWDGLSDKQIINRIRQEVNEISRAIAKKKTPEVIISECADVANFAMMLADNIKQRYDDEEN